MENLSLSTMKEGWTVSLKREMYSSESRVWAEALNRTRGTRLDSFLS